MLVSLINKGDGLTRVLAVLLLLILSSLTTSCSILKVQEDVRSLQNSSIFVGIISSSQPECDIPIVVAAYSNKDGNHTVAHYTTLHSLGSYELMVPRGEHNIVAFGDTNGNLVYDIGEPAGQILSAEQASIPTGGVSSNLDIVISNQHRKPIDLSIGFRMPLKSYDGFHSTSPGAIADLEKAIFSMENGQKAYWSGMEFFKEVGGNVYFLEAYDPTKIPILFVHGAGGSPQNWRTFFNSIDRNKFQPWFFYYPSGMSIDAMSYLLFWKLHNLQNKFRFKEMHITAHSLGGLVSRSLLVNYGHMLPLVTKFISISTPWGGEEMAELGVKYSPGVIPAWRDIQPGSEYVDSILKQKLPPSVDYYLFFGYRGNRNIFRPNNDNTVTLKSQLDYRSQRDASMVYGFNEDHISILSSKRVLSQYNAILAESSKPQSASSNISKARLQVDFSFELSEEQPKPTPILYLRPVDSNSSETWFYISADGSGTKHGPFLPGDYEVSLLATAFTPEPTKIPITITDSTNPTVEFRMKPVGHIRGYVAKEKQPHMYAGKDRKPNTEIEIESITLSGNGIERHLVPLKKKGSSYAELYPKNYLSQTDYSFKGAFFFFRLPEGNYDLTVNIKGHKPFSGTYNVVPGQYQTTVIIEPVRE